MTSTVFTSGTVIESPWLNDVNAATYNGGAVYTPAGASAVPTTVQAKLRESVSVLDFGAVGDGVTDDTTAIQAALNSGYSVFIPDGTYLVSSALSVTGEVFGQSWNAILKQGASDNSIFNCQTGSVSISNMTLQGTTTNIDSFVYAIYNDFATQPTSLRVENVQIKGSSNSTGFTGGMYFVAVQNAQILNNRIRNIRGTQSANGIFFNGYLPVNAQTIASGTSLPLSATGNLFFVSGTTTINTIAEGANTNNVVTLAFQGSLTLTNSASLQLLDSRNVITVAAADTSTPEFFVVMQKVSAGVWKQIPYSTSVCNFCRVINNNIEFQTGSADADKYGYLGIGFRMGGTGNIISENYIKYGNQTQISCVSTTNFLDRFQGLVISNNTCEELTAPTISVHGYQENAIELGGRAENCIITGNFINRAFRYGIWLSEDGTYNSNGYNIISNNTLRDVQLHGINVLGVHRAIINDNVVINAGNFIANTYSGIYLQPQPYGAGSECIDIQVHDNIVYGPTYTQYGVYIYNPSAITSNRVSVVNNELRAYSGGIYDTGLATRRIGQVSNTRFPFTNAISGFKSGTDNTAINVLSIVIPNNKVAGLLKIRFVVNSNQILRVASGEFIVTFGRSTGQDTGLSGTTVNAASLALAGGSETFTSGPTWSISSLSGTSSNAQTATIRCLLDSDSNLATDIHYWAELLSDSYNGADETAEVSIYSA